MSNAMPCAHCNSTGTCSSGENNYSCAVCVKYNKLKNDTSHKGLICSVCKGLGAGEIKSDRINNIITPFLAVVIVYFVLFIISINMNNSNLDKLLIFGGTLIGSITGYYFAEKRRDVK